MHAGGKEFPILLMQQKREIYGRRASGNNRYSEFLGKKKKLLSEFLNSRKSPPKNVKFKTFYINFSVWNEEYNIGKISRACLPIRYDWTIIEAKK